MGGGSPGGSSKNILGDKDFAPQLATIIVSALLCMGIYHYHLVQEGRRYNARKIKYMQEQLKQNGSEQQDNQQQQQEQEQEEEEMGDEDQGNPATVLATREPDGYWDLISPQDLRYGSNEKLVSRKLLGFFRGLVLVYCVSMWAVYFSEKTCCIDFEKFEVLGFVLFSLFFLLGCVVSVTPHDPLSRMRPWEKLFIVMYEIVIPTSLFSLYIYWKYFSLDYRNMFPSANKRALNSGFATVNTILILLEVGMDRVIVRTRRWMYMSYFALCYLLSLIVVEKIHGENYQVYETQGFLQLKSHSFPIIVKLLMGHFVCHYIMCLLVTLKQRFITTPLLLPVDPELMGPDPVAYPLTEHSATASELGGMRSNSSSPVPPPGEMWEQGPSLTAPLIQRS